MPASPSPESFLPVSAVVFDILLALAGGDLHGYDTVSYTHLTLPTILRV